MWPISVLTRMHEVYNEYLQSVLGVCIYAHFESVHTTSLKWKVLLRIFELYYKLVSYVIATGNKSFQGLKS